MKKEELIKKIKWHPLTDDQYFKVEYPKKQIVLHHTASGGDRRGDIDYWQSNSDKIATAFVVDRDGTIWQCFNSKYYAYHLGVPASTFKKFGVNNTSLNLHQHSIGVELDNWGYLDKKGDRFYAWAGIEIPEEKVQVYTPNYLGKRYFEKYTEAQLTSTKELITYLCEEYNIPKNYNSNMWFANKDALSGKSGIWSHTSYRESGKWDAHPQLELINMLNNLR